MTEVLKNALHASHVLGGKFKTNDQVIYQWEGSEKMRK